MNKQNVGIDTKMAIKILKGKQPHAMDSDYYYKKAVVLAISALEKQMPKKPILYGDIEDGKLLCPNCEEDLWDIKYCGFSGCPYCLQAIDWRNEDE